ncbi:MAG: TPM domain-containing protein [Bacteroidales bacterium]
MQHKNTLKLSCFLLLSFFSLSVFSQIPTRPQPPRLVNDMAQILSPEQNAYLEDILLAFADSSSNQITLVTVPDLQGYDAAQFAYEIGENWGVGNKKYNNGVVLLVKPKNQTKGEVFIAPGYGLEGALPDAICKQIIEQEMIPQFRRNDYYQGILNAVNIIKPIASGEYSSSEYATSAKNVSPLAIMAILFFVILLIILVGAAGRNKGGDDFNNKGRGGGLDPFSALLLGGMIGRSSHGGSFGGFSGGGGGGFGGFGGGSFGGGGAGGSW